MKTYSPYSHHLFLLIPCFGLLVLLGSCVKPSGRVAFSHPALVEIDSLLWSRPDSAFMELQRFAERPEASSLNTFDGHCFQLLLSELLYKNDCAQTNREELLKAVGYFDSLASGNKDAALTFLDARGHYINGVGYYERDSVVEACQEYLKAVELMEERFKERELTGRKAQFMALAYNRLGDLFSEQFMMEFSIVCYENALVFCKINNTSPFGVPKILYRIGKQYDKLEKLEMARWYYEFAINEIGHTDNLVYRDIVSNKAFTEYQLGFGLEPALIKLKRVVGEADNEQEKMQRFLTIGGLFFKEGVYDSALFYLKSVYECEEGIHSRMVAAECLRIIYDSLGDEDSSEKCVHFISKHAKPDWENKTMIAELEDVFQVFLNNKASKSTFNLRLTKANLIMLFIAGAIAIIAMAVIVVIKHKLHEGALQSERQTHRTQQLALSGRLKQSNDELRRLKGKKNYDDYKIGIGNTPVTAFADEPVCRLIMERVKEGNFKSKVDCNYYKEYALEKQQLLDLKVAVDYHYGQLTNRLKIAYPKLTKTDLDYCCLYLLGLSDADIAALMQRAYNTVIERKMKIKKIVGCDNLLSIALRNKANEY